VTWAIELALLAAWTTVHFRTAATRLAGRG
jgi:hypothetical protein